MKENDFIVCPGVVELAGFRAGLRDILWISTLNSIRLKTGQV